MSRAYAHGSIGILAALLCFGAAGARAADLDVPDVAATAWQAVADLHGVFSRPPRNMPSNAMPGGALLGNGDLGVAIGGPPQVLQFYIGKADFFGVLRGGIMPVGSLVLQTPDLNAASYRMRQYIGPANVTGDFAVGGTAVLSMTAWVSAADNRLVIQLKNNGSKSLAMSTQLLDGYGTPGNPATYGSNPDSTWLKVSPDTVWVDIGNRFHGGSPGPFDGQITDVRIYNQAIGPNSIQTRTRPPLFSWSPSKDSTGDDVAALRLPQKSFAVDARIFISSAGERNFIFSAMGDPIHPRNYPYQRGFNLCLVGGKLSATLNHTTVTASTPLPLKKWINVTATYDGKTLAIFADQKRLASTNDFPTAGQVMGYDQTAIHFGDPKLPFDGCGPVGMMVQRVVGVQTKQDHKSLNFTIPPGGQASVVVAVVTDRNTPDYTSAATQLASKSTPDSLDDLARTHLAWWKKFWSKSFVTIPDKAVQDEWYASLYLLACCDKPTSPPPGLWGNFITAGNMGWQGDYTLDYNYEAPFWAAFPTNHLELAENYDQPLLDYLPRGRAIAQHNGDQGLLFYTHLIPPPGWDDDPSRFMQQKSQALFACVNCVMRWRYTHDLAYAKKVYPLLKGTADFWDHYLVMQNGRYVDENDGAFEESRHDVNPATTLAFLRLLYPALVQISQAMDVDADLRPVWTYHLAHLSGLTIVPAESLHDVRGQPPDVTLGQLLGAGTTGKLVIRDTERGNGFPVPGKGKGGRIQETSPGMNSVQVIFPGWMIGLESDARQLKAAKDTVQLAAQWFDHNNGCDFYPAAACAGYDPASILQHLDTLIRWHMRPNFAFFTQGGGTEDFAIVPTTLCQMLLQSYQSDIHVFADWPADQDAAFGNLLACGGFLVSSRMSGGQVAYVRIHSDNGGVCRLANPWPDQAVRIQSGQGQQLSRSGAVLIFPTAKGQTLLLVPSAAH